MNCVSDGSKDETLSVAIFGLSANPPTGDEVTIGYDSVNRVDFSSSISIARDIEES